MHLPLNKSEVLTRRPFKWAASHQLLTHTQQEGAQYISQKQDRVQRLQCVCSPLLLSRFIMLSFALLFLPSTSEPMGQPPTCVFHPPPPRSLCDAPSSILFHCHPWDVRIHADYHWNTVKYIITPGLVVNITEQKPWDDAWIRSSK